MGKFLLDVPRTGHASGDVVQGQARVLLIDCTYTSTGSVVGPGGRSSPRLRLPGLGIQCACLRFAADLRGALGDGADLGDRQRCPGTQRGRCRGRQRTAVGGRRRRRRVGRSVVRATPWRSPKTRCWPISPTSCSTTTERAEGLGGDVSRNRLSRSPARTGSLINRCTGAVRFPRLRHRQRSRPRPPHAVNSCRNWLAWWRRAQACAAGVTFWRLWKLVGAAAEFAAGRPPRSGPDDDAQVFAVLPRHDRVYTGAPITSTDR